MKDNLENNKFTYNDGVIVKKNAPQKFHPGEDGIICGMNEITTEAEADEYACGVGEWVYIVEFGDGFSIEVAECHLEIDPNRLKYCLRERIVMKLNIPDDYHPSEVVSILSYHHISDKSLAKKFNLKLGDPIYIMKTEQGEEFLAPEAFIERKVDSETEV